jgi:hypothetical protein
MKSYKKLVEELQKISGQQGSNPGGKFKDLDSGKEYYIKHPKAKDQDKTEVLSAKIHELMGVKTLNPELITHNDKPSVKTEYNNELEPLTSKHINTLTTDHHKQIGSIYASGILTKNWDAFGTGMDYGEGNVMLDKKKGHLVSIDQGGSFNHRAQGGHKDYGSDIDEKDTFRDSSMSEGAKFVNKSLEHPEVKNHIAHTLQNLDLNKVHTAFKESGLANHEDLHKTFLERHKKLLDHFSK